MRKYFSISILTIFLCLNSCKDEASLEIVTNGVSNYEIVFMGSATESQYKSTELLKNYIDEISKSDISIVDESSQSIDK